MPDMPTFDAGKWRAKLLMTPAEYKELARLAHDDGALTAHLDEQLVIRLSDEGTVRVPFSELGSEVQEAWRVSKKDSVSAAMGLLARQLVVVALSYCEAIVVEFSQALFEAAPIKMHDFIGSGECKGVVPLGQILDATSREVLLRQLAEYAGKVIGTKKLSKALERISSLAGTTFPADMIATLQSFSDTRNRIIHDLHEPTITPGNVSAVFNTLGILVTHLVNAARMNGIVTDDPSDLSNFPEVE